MNRGQFCGLAQHETNEDDDVETGKGGDQAFVVLVDEPATSDGPGEGPLDHPRAGQEHEKRRLPLRVPYGQASGSLTTARVMRCPRAAVAGFSLVGTTPIDEGQLDARAAGRPLHGGEPAHLGAAIGGGGDDVEREQVTQPVDCQVELEAVLALESAIFTRH